MHEDGHTPANIFMDSCTTGCSGIYDKQAYHSIFPDLVLQQGTEICHIEPFNCGVALKLWVEQVKDKLVHLHCDSASAVAIMQAGHGRDRFLEACSREAWLISAIHGMTLIVGTLRGSSSQSPPMS